MKTRPIAVTTLTVLVIILQLAACHKAADSRVVPDTVPETVPPRSFNGENCNAAPDYGSSLICAKFKGPGNDYIITPQNNSGSGTYFAWPQGLMIDAATGAINVSKSEAGARYLVGFVKAGTTDTCAKELVLGGITYADSIYVLENNDTLAIPYFNADPAAAPVCDVSNDNDYPGNGNPGGNNKCEFDDGDDDDNGNGASDEPPPGQRANDQHVKVRTMSGVINLKRSLEEGMFGPNPKNGDKKDVTIYYRLADCSNKTLQKITVRFYFFETKSSIPQNLVMDVHSKRTAFLATDYLSPRLAPRPPQIIVTRFAD